MRRLCVIGCGAAKLDRRAPAREMYTGCLFRDALGYAEGQGYRAILILSAEHGALDLDREIEPYNTRLGDLSLERRAALGAHVRNVLRLRAEGPAADLTILAGAPYVALVLPLTAEGWTVRDPLAGMTQGERRGWFAAQRRAG